MYKIIDLFAGCGGISRGFQLTSKFSTELAVEIEPHFAAAFKENITNYEGNAPEVYTGDIRELVSNDDLFQSYLESKGIENVDDIDVIVGGPPCQGFSRNGVRQYESESKELRFYDDPRNYLYKSFLYFVEKIRSPIVLIENVREFLNYGKGKFSADLIAKMNELGYEIKYMKICAADYGVPQLRHRVFFVALHKSKIRKYDSLEFFPEPEYFNNLHANTMFSGYNTVRDAIGNLPMPVDKQILSPQKFSPSRTSRSELSNFLASENKVLYNHVSRKLSEINLKRLKAVGTGRMKDIAKNLQTKKFYGGAYGRLAWDEPSLTITSWVYHVGSGRFGHPDQDRAITMREAARLQTFDDDFVFPPLINPTSRMIGNAVPPLLALKFAELFYSILKDNEKMQLTPQPRQATSGISQLR